MTAVLQAAGLGKRYGRTWALRDCSVDLPEARVVALVGPNGAGKTTLLHLATGLLAPSAGEIRVFGAPPANRPGVLARIGFLAQDKPLYRGFTVAEMLRYGARLNPGWDDAVADRWLARFELPPDRRIGQLSGGQRTQLAVALTLAKRPRLLLLDEPMADLDPLVRHDLTRLLMETVAAEGLTVVLSSHVLAELATVCDYLVLLAVGHAQLAGDTEDLLAGHKLLVGPRRDAAAGPHQVVAASHTERQTTLLVRVAGPVHDPAWAVHDIGLEQLVLAYMRHPQAATLPSPTLAVAPPGDKEVSR